MRVDHSAGKGTSGMDKNINKACLLLHCRYSNRPLLDVLLVECAASLCVCVCACVCVCRTSTKAVSITALPLFHPSSTVCAAC